MANCHSLFESFNSNISLTNDKRDKMIKSKDALREKIKVYFKEHHPKYVPKFWIQGSYKMKTTIRTKEDICDLDDGVYFEKEPDVTPTTLQGWVKDAVDGHTSKPAQHRKKCIRTVFVNDYEIDMPVYWEVEKGKTYRLAVKNSQWKGNESDCKELIDWFETKKDTDGVLIKLVKYLKTWGDQKAHSMPSGLAMSILATNAKSKITYSHKRDDKSLRDTLAEIKKKLDAKFECIVPATPKDDLFTDYDQTKKDNFLNALQSFIDDANTAIDTEKNHLKSSTLWKKHLGNRFPDGEDKEDADMPKAQSLNNVATVIFNGNSYTDKQGNTTSNTSYVKNKPHTFYGQ